MKKALCRCLCIFVGTFFLMPTSVVIAVEDPFVLIPKADNKYESDVEALGEKENSGKFWNIYNDKAKNMNNDIGAQFGSGIMNWDTILGLLERVVKFLANGALVVGAAMIIYAGYLYALTAISGESVDQTSQAKEAIKWAVIGIVIVIFSYAILRWVIHAFL